MGGKLFAFRFRAKGNKNIDQLLDVLLLVADLKKNASWLIRTVCYGTATVHVDKGQGPVATVLVQAGTLKVGDTFRAALTMAAHGP